MCSYLQLILRHIGSIGIPSILEVVSSSLENHIPLCHLFMHKHIEEHRYWSRHFRILSCIYAEISWWGFASQVGCKIWTLPYGRGMDNIYFPPTYVKSFLLSRILMWFTVIVFLSQVLSVGAEVQEQVESGKKVSTMYSYIFFPFLKAI